MKYILSLDQGTTSSRSILFDQDQKIVAMAQQEFRQIFPQNGWVEHDPIEIWNTQLETIHEVLQKANITPTDIEAIGITNQRETTVLWDRQTGKPVYNAIVWQDKRTKDFCDILKSNDEEQYITQSTGLIIDSYFSGTKVHWILENIPEAKVLLEQGDLMFGTIDTWLLWNLTGGKVHATDYSNASRTMMYNIHSLQWDERILSMMHIPFSILPSVHDSSGFFGMTDVALLGLSIPITGIAGDQQAALFGQKCWSTGEAKNTYGTGCFMLMNTGEKPIASTNGLLTTIAWGMNGKVTYALEGSVFIAGAAIQWLRDGLKWIDSALDSEYYASNLATNEGVYFVPAFSGLGAPHWDMDARGAIYGLTRGTTRRHIIRAALESMAYQTYDVLKTMESESKITLKALKVDGGACANNLLMQFQSDILQKPIHRPQVIESTALGAALLAGIQTGFYKINDQDTLQKSERIFTPQMDEKMKEGLLKGWDLAVRRTMMK
jgi:glycerol kinase